jgi:hypothetical protein
MACILHFSSNLKVRAMLKNGFLKLLVQLDKLEAYWTNMLKEYPGHPAASMIRSAALISIYGVLVGCFLISGPPPFFRWTH